MSNLVKRCTIFIDLSSRKEVESFSKFPPITSKIILKNTNQVPKGFMITLNSKFHVQSAKLNSQINSIRIKIMSTFYLLSILVLNSIRFFEQIRRSTNYVVGYTL